MKAAERLYRRGLLRRFPHGREHVWQLNLNMLDKVKEKIRKYFKEF